MTYLAEERHHAFGASASRLIELIGRYPNVDPDEVEEMIAIYPTLTILEVGLLSSDDKIATPLDAFVRTHSKRLRRSWQHHLVFGISATGTFAFLAVLVALAMS